MHGPPAFANLILAVAFFVYIVTFAVFFVPAPSLGAFITAPISVVTCLIATCVPVTFMMPRGNKTYAKRRAETEQGAILKNNSQIRKTSDGAC